MFPLLLRHQWIMAPAMISSSEKLTVLLQAMAPEDEVVREEAEVVVVLEVAAVEDEMAREEAVVVREAAAVLEEAEAVVGREAAAVLGEAEAAAAAVADEAVPATASTLVCAGSIVCYVFSKCNGNKKNTVDYRKMCIPLDSVIIIYNKAIIYSWHGCLWYD